VRQAAVIEVGRRRTAAPAAVRRRILWLVVGSVGVIAAVAIAMRLTGMLGWDTPAHLYKIALLRHGGAMLWDNNWYGGAYQIVTYGFVFYWLAQFVGYTALVVASAGVLPVLFYLYMRRVYEVTSFVPAITLAGVLAVYLANGQDPFLFALALTMGGLVLETCGRRLLAAVPIAIAGFANPLAVMVGGIFLIAAYIAMPERRPGLNRLALYLLPFGVARLVLTIFFWERATYLYRPVEILVYVSFGVVGAVATRMSADPARRAKETLFLTFAVMAVIAAIVPPNPVGGNFGRFFFVFGLPLLLSVRGVPLPRALTVPLIIGVAIGQLIVPATHYVSRAQGASAKAAFFAPALTFAASHSDPDYRFHVVALSNHWEAYYFSVHNYPITRGWYRQSDALHNALLNQRQFTAGQYVAWLRQMGVEYVFLPDAPLDLSGAQETAIVTTSPRFSVVYHAPGWTIFRLRGARPLIQPLGRSGRAEILALDHESVSLRVASRGAYLVKVSYSPYWRLTGSGTLTRSHNDFVVVHVPAAGRYDMRIAVTPESLWHEIVARLE
jgi:hypothetical protein